VLPPALYGGVRRNSRGLDLSNEAVLEALGRTLQDSATTAWRAVPLVDGQRATAVPPAVRDPADRRSVVGSVVERAPPTSRLALDAAERALPVWQPRRPPIARARSSAPPTDAAADAALIGLAIREAGKTAANAIGEVREAIDFLRYYAAQARCEAGASPGAVAPLGIVVCISPWNFPLAIFTGQIAAALAAGNAVIAKPAEQTPLIAAEAVRLLHARRSRRRAAVSARARRDRRRGARRRPARARRAVHRLERVARLLQRHSPAASTSRRTRPP
jgi:RHH-type proline utilization regulon transcriptional repressor/proline dehydrogenase/delta 1-pyrroline-5-carboxylate dehydrogenase